MADGGGSSRGEVMDKALLGLRELLPTLKEKLIRPLDVGVVANATALTASQFHVAYMLRHEGPRPVGDIARRMLIAKSNITAVVDRLVDLGVAERVPDADDRRVVNLRLTLLGSEMIARVEASFEASMRERLERLSAHDLELLGASIETLLAVMSKIS